MAVVSTNQQAKQFASELRGLRRADKDIKNAVKVVNRRWAAYLRKQIRAEAPRTGGSVDHRNPNSHAGRRPRKKGRTSTRTGAWAASVRSKVGLDYARIEGGGPRAPHFIVNEFGGEVWWMRSKKNKPSQVARQTSHRSYRAARSRLGGNVGHIIPVRARSASKGGFPAGWYFFPTCTRHIDDVWRGYYEDVCDTLFENMHRSA